MKKLANYSKILLKIIIFLMKLFILVTRIIVMHQCYYCEQIFDSKESLYDHVEIHSDTERNREISERQKAKRRAN